MTNKEKNAEYTQGYIPTINWANIQRDPESSNIVRLHPRSNAQLNGKESEHDYTN